MVLVVEWIELTQDRLEWWVFMNMVIYH